jgi:uncharacterized protein YjbI with pentapeptide repeats
MYEEGVPRFKWNQVAAAIRSRFGHDANVDAYDYDIRACSFIRRDPITDEFTFTHESFAEFFVASFIYDSLAKGGIEELGTRVHTAQVMQFLGEHLGTKDIITALVEDVQAMESDVLPVNALVLLAAWSAEDKPVALAEQKFADTTLAGLRPTAMSFHKCTWQAGRFIKTKWAQCKFDQCRFERMQFVESSFEENCAFQGTVVSGASFEQCGFSDLSSQIEASDVTFVDCRFQDCGWRQSSLTNCAFRQGKLENVDLSFAELRRVSLEAVTVKKVEWPTLVFSNVKFKNVIFVDGGTGLLNAVKALPGGVKARAISLHRCKGLEKQAARDLRLLGVEVK